MPGERRFAEWVGTPPGQYCFYWNSVAVQAQGRTTILKLNYRNTPEGLWVARNFATELLSGRDAGENRVHMSSRKRRPPRRLPRLIHCEGHWQEWDCLVTRIRDEQANGRVLSDMAIIYRSSSHAQASEHASLERFLCPPGILYLVPSGVLYTNCC